MSLEIPEPQAAAAPDSAPDAPSVADGALHALDPRTITLQRITSWIFTAFVATGSLGMLLVTWLGSAPTWRLGRIVAFLDLPLPAADLLVRAVLWLAGVGFLMWHAHLWPPIEYRHATYRVDASGIEIRRGVFWRSVLNVPRSRVQHTDVSQGPLERRFGLGTLIIYTAGTEYAKVSLSGLEHTRALLIREHLLPREPSDAV